MSAIVLALEVGAGAQRAPEDGDVLAHDGQRLLDRHPEHGVHRGTMTHAETEREAAADLLVEGQRGLGHDDRVTRVDRHHAVAEPDARGRLPVRRQHEEGVAPEAVRHPRALVAETLGAPHEIHRRREVAAGRDEGRQPHGLRTLTSMQSSPKSYSREVQGPAGSRTYSR